MYVFYEIIRLFPGKIASILSKLLMFYANKCLILHFCLQIKHILTKRNFEMYLRTGKTNIFSVFHVENGKIQSMLLVLCVFQCRNTCNLG